MPEVLDQAALDSLLQMVGGDADFVDELVDTFLADVPQQLAELRAAVAAGTAADAVRPAHTLKGTAASIGARAVEATSRSIEEERPGGQHGRSRGTGRGTGARARGPRDGAGRRAGTSLGGCVSAIRRADPPRQAASAAIDGWALA